jgi:hypothetical protein
MHDRLPPASRWSPVWLPSQLDENNSSCVVVAFLPPPVLRTSHKATLIWSVASAVDRSFIRICST